MTKADIIENIYEKVGISKKETAKVIHVIFDTIKETLENEESVKVSGFGTFSVRRKRARRGRNPQTDEEITITARKVITFKASNVLKDLVNS